MKRVERTKIARLAFGPMFAALILVFAFSSANAQNRPYDQSFLGGVNVPASVAAGQTIRIRIAVPDTGGSRARGGGHVKVFDGTSVLLYETSAEALLGGAIHEFEIDPMQLPVDRDPLTGRAILRIKLELSLKNAVIDSDSVEFPTMFELVERETGKAVLIGLLLPAIQK